MSGILWLMSRSGGNLSGWLSKDFWHSAIHCSLSRGMFSFVGGYVFIRRWMRFSARRVALTFGVVSSSNCRTCLLSSRFFWRLAFSSSCDLRRRTPRFGWFPDTNSLSVVSAFAFMETWSVDIVFNRRVLLSPSPSQNSVAGRRIFESEAGNQSCVVCQA